MKIETDIKFVAEQGTETVSTVRPQVADAADVKKPEPRFYRVIWRWHFYAGLIVVPVLLVVTLTGAIYVFREELERAFKPQMMTVKPRAQMIPFSQIAANAMAYTPSSGIVHGVGVEGDPTTPARVYFEPGPERYQSVFVNQYTGAVLGSEEYHDGFFGVVLRIHRTLWIGTTGRLIVELTTSWGIVLIITGLYLWWPRGAKRKGVWLPAVSGKRYVVWRDWHAVPGFYFSLFAFLIMATGLFFTFLFGQGYRGLAYITNSYPLSYVHPPHSEKKEGASPINLDEVVRIAQSIHPRKEMFINFPHDAEGSFSVYLGDFNSPSTLNQVFIDQFSGAVIDVIRWKDLTPMAKMSLSAYPIHVGSLYGMPTKILAFIACLVIIAMTVTGAVMWWVRRPKEKTGFPHKPKDFKPAKWLILLICALGVVTPAMGLSLLPILLGDWVVRRYRGLAEARNLCDSD
jgi:uncharacterized iron-regulated membrane protein